MSALDGAAPWAEGWRFLTPDVPPLSFSARVHPEDFVVEEVLRDDTGGEGGYGSHVHFEIEKRGIDTRIAVRRLARALDVGPGAIGYAGLKDARAVARQTLSVEHVDPERILGLELPGVRVLSVRRRDRKLRVGQLQGNRFHLVLRDLAEADVPHFEAVLAAVRKRGLPNYYGAQRFGRDGRGHELGCLLLRRQHAEYVRRVFELDRPEAERGPVPGELRRAQQLLLRGAREPEAVAEAVPAPLRRLHLGALQALLFNRVVAARIDSLDRLFAGDLAFRHPSHASFPVEDPDELSERVRSHELSPSGPYAGYAVPAATGEPGRIEAEAWAAVGVAPADFERPGRGLAQKGARRPLRVPVEELSSERRGAELHLSCFLPKGSYATSLLAELSKTLGP